MRDDKQAGGPVASLENVEGFSSAAARVSHTTAAGELRLEPIDGVRYRLLRPVSHHQGHLTEAFRIDWGVSDAPLVQVNMTVTFPGAYPGLGNPPSHGGSPVCRFRLALHRLLRWPASIAYLREPQ